MFNKYYIVITNFYIFEWLTLFLYDKQPFKNVIINYIILNNKQANQSKFVR